MKLHIQFLDCHTDYFYDKNNVQTLPDLCNSYFHQLKSKLSRPIYIYMCIYMYIYVCIYTYIYIKEAV